jgi:hypothetical protein
MTAMLQFYDKVGFFENLVPISSMIGALNGDHHCGIITAESSLRDHHRCQRQINRKFCCFTKRAGD